MRVRPERTVHSVLIVFPGLILFSLARPSLAGRIVWTIAIASLPLFWVLMFISQIPTLLGVVSTQARRTVAPSTRLSAALGIFIASLS